MPLFTLGSLVMDVPMGIVGLDYVTGADFAVKPVVGAAQPREFMGEADSHISINAQLLPHAMERNGLPTGVPELNLLDQMARSGAPYLLLRSGPPGEPLGYWLVEHFTKRGTKLDRKGQPRIIEVELQLVKSPTKSTTAQALVVLTNLVGSALNAPAGFASTLDNAINGAPTSPAPTQK